MVDNCFDQKEEGLRRRESLDKRKGPDPQGGCRHRGGLKRDRRKKRSAGKLNREKKKGTVVRSKNQQKTKESRGKDEGERGGPRKVLKAQSGGGGFSAMELRAKLRKTKWVDQRGEEWKKNTEDTRRPH